MTCDRQPKCDAKGDRILYFKNATIEESILDERRTSGLRDSSNDSKFVQQHLANERTFLAWVRTSLTIIGIGFLAAGLVFQSSPYNHFAHWLASIVGFGAVILGVCILTLATRDFFMKQKGINSDNFRSPTTLIWLIFVSLGIIGMLLIGLVFIMLS
ncbi:YidH family protein [Cohnella luojiensis]|uniref:DUF202 domain-containing protein n=1 Tax=Cohnella luojiensis TaxID=652876 RepID=A0A4Y8M218_9BACL|nr:DUF202 domain-containing protein [Cohnella luojiensis]TFE27807.1 DUF202 domain-containing protein [Cohnella luojiensis]